MIRPPHGGERSKTTLRCQQRRASTRGYALFVQEVAPRYGISVKLENECKLNESENSCS